MEKAKWTILTNYFNKLVLSVYKREATAVKNK